MSFFRSMGLIVAAPFFAIGIIVTTASQADPLRFSTDNFLESRPHLGDYVDSITEVEAAKDEEDWKEDDEEVRGQIKEINLALKGKMSPSERFDLKLKEALALSKRESYERHRVAQVYLRRWDAYMRGEAQSEPTLSLKKSEQILFKIVNVLRAGLKTVKKNPNLDQMTYLLALNLCRVGNENAGFYFNQFNRRFKTSALMNDVRMARAECLFDSGKYSQAGAIYTKLLKSKENPTKRGYAHYKLAWSHIMMSQGKFTSTAVFPKVEGGLKKAYNLVKGEDTDYIFDLREEVLRDIAWIYALSGRETDALVFFKSSDATKKYMPEYYFRKAERLIQAKKLQPAAKYLTWIVKNSKEYIRLPESYQMLVNIYDNLGKYDDVNKTAKAMAKDISDDGDWPDAHEYRVKNAEANLEYLLRTIAGSFQDRGNSEGGDKAWFRHAVNAYANYLNRFEDGKEEYELSFQKASSLFSMGSYRKASNLFYEIFEADVENPVHKRDALFNGILSLNKLDEQQKYKKLPELGKVKEPIDLPPIKELLVERIQEFIEAFPEDESILAMRYSEAQNYLLYGHYEEAEEKLEIIGMKHTGTESARNAIHTVLSLYAERGDWQGLKKKCMSYLYSDQMADPELQSLLSSTLEHAENKIQQSKQAGKNTNEKEKSE